MNARQPANRRLNRDAAAVTPIEDPFEHEHVVSETGPEKITLQALAEPVHIKNERGLGQTFSNVEPMPEIVSDVVATERKHRHWIAADLSDLAGCGGGCFRGHGRAEINAVFPVKRLKHERDCSAASAAENDRADWNALALLEIRIKNRIIAHRCGEPAIRMRRFFF